jgi:hypothetical protein
LKGLTKQNGGSDSDERKMGAVCRLREKGMSKGEVVVLCNGKMNQRIAKREYTKGEKNKENE